MFSAGFFPHRCLNRPVSAAHVFRRLQSQADSIDIRFMRDRIRQQLQHHRIPDLRRAGDRLLFVLGRARFHDRDAVAREQLLRFKFVQHAPPSSAHLLHDFTHLAARAGGFRRLHQRRSFIQPAQVVGISPHIGEGARRGVWIGKGRDARRVQDRGSFGDAVAAHPTGQQRLACRVRQRFQALRHLRGIRQPLRRDDGQQSVARRIFRRDLDRLHEALGVGIRQYVHRIAVAPVRREEGVHLMQRFGGENGEFSSGRHE